ILHAREDGGGDEENEEEKDDIDHGGHGDDGFLIGSAREKIHRSSSTISAVLRFVPRFILIDIRISLTSTATSSTRAINDCSLPRKKKKNPMQGMARINPAAVVTSACATALASATGLTALISKAMKLKALIIPST